MKTFASAVLGVAVALLFGCSSSKDTPTATTASGIGNQGESCQATSDCVSGLLCIQNVCSKPAAPTEAGSPPVAPLGKRGESCRSRADCESGLACFNNVCGVANFGITTTGKTCVGIECTAPSDCCPPPLLGAATCAQYAQSCEGGLSSYCTEYNNYCVCDVSKYACEQNQCVQACTDDAGFYGNTCPTGESVCSGGRCVQCAKDADCALSYGSTTVCIANKCQKKCTGDFECAAFYKCQSSACVKVGCSSDRECIFANDNPLSVCTADKTCKVPCQMDVECNRAGTAGVASCVNGQCLDIGCETEDDCRALYSSTGGTKTHWLCQAPTP